MRSSSPSPILSLSIWLSSFLALPLASQSTTTSGATAPAPLLDGNMKNKHVWHDDQNRLLVKLYPRALDITWGSNPTYWTYFLETIPVEVAKLENVCWFDVKGKFDISKLTVGTEYEILFDIELTPDAGGWEEPVIIEHNTPFGLTTKFEMKFEHLIGEGRTEISIGKLTWSWIPLGAPKATFRMYEHSDDHWKKGLIIHGLTIKPAN